MKLRRKPVTSLAAQVNAATTMAAKRALLQQAADAGHAQLR